MWLLELWHLIYPRLLTGFGMLFFFTNLSLQVRYLALFLLFSVIDGFEWFWMGSPLKNIQLMLIFSSKLNWNPYIISIAKNASTKIGTSIHFMKFLSPEVDLYLYKSAIRPCMECCCHVQVGAPSYSLELLDKLQKRMCRTVGPSLAASLEPLTHRRNVASLSLFYRYYFGRCSSELAQLVPLPFSRGRSARYSDRLHDFSVTIPKCYKNVCVNSFFPRTDRLRNSVPIECFPLTYDLHGFKSRVNRHLLTVVSF